VLTPARDSGDGLWRRLDCLGRLGCRGGSPLHILGYYLFPLYMGSSNYFIFKISVARCITAILNFAPHELACCSYNLLSTLISFMSTTQLGLGRQGKGGVSMRGGK